MAVHNLLYFLFFFMLEKVAKYKHLGNLMLCLRKTWCSPKEDLGHYSLNYMYTHSSVCVCTHRAHSHPPPTCMCIKIPGMTQKKRVTVATSLESNWGTGSFRVEMCLFTTDSFLLFWMFCYVHLSPFQNKVLKNISAITISTMKGNFTLTLPWVTRLYL